ncbi:MAG: DUF1338 domain-containing protein [Planctomycetota bacterium]|nr:DUF1338 domain-containing protein [Planctomycetota bacterium]MDA1178356.1 DUF1338 domain-containing protein [Planctomycetota bacterium]
MSAKPSDEARTNGQAEGPHAAIPYRHGLDHFALKLLDALWCRYRTSVTYVQTYEAMIAAAGAKFVNDHIAFRTLASQQPLLGIASLSRIFETLGYYAAGCYHFPDKHLSAVHYEHPNREFPKVFLSELQIWRLSPPLREAIESLLRSHCAHPSSRFLASIERLKDEPNYVGDDLLARLLHFFDELPWEIPGLDLLGLAATESQYAAWALVHGYRVNHFTSLVNSHGVSALDDIDKTVAAMRAAGIPMKDAIEGQPGSRLRQSATAAVDGFVKVLDNDHVVQTEWSYAYFEIAERGLIHPTATKHPERFEGFLGSQAAQLFDMTRRS